MIVPILYILALVGIGLGAFGVTAGRFQFAWAGVWCLALAIAWPALSSLR